MRINKSDLKKILFESIMSVVNERHDIIRRYADGYEDYDGYELDPGDAEGEQYIEIDNNLYKLAIKELFGKIVSDEELESYELPEDVLVSYSISTSYSRGDYYTPPSSESELDSWEVVPSELNSLETPEKKAIVQKAAELYMESSDLAEFLN